MFLEFTIDSENQYQEDSEENNTIEKKVYPLISSYDFAAIDIEVNPENPVEDGDTIITIITKNNGKKNLYSTYGLSNYQLSLPNFKIEETTITYPSPGDVLEVGDAFYYVYEGYFEEAGPVELMFNFDKDDKIVEISENNNSVSKLVTVASSTNTDISVDEIIVDLEEPIINVDTEIIVRLKNNSGYNLTSSRGFSEDDIYKSFSGFYVKDESHDQYPDFDNQLEPGDIFKYTYTGTFSKAGENNLHFRVDTRKRLNETNEDNNSLTIPINVYASEKDRDDFTVTGERIDYISSSSVVIYWNTSKNTTGKIAGKINNDVNLSSSSGESQSHKAAWGGLSPGYKYYYQLVMENGVVLKQSNLKNFTAPTSDHLSFAADPVLSLDEQNKEIRVSWETNLVSDGQVSYKKSTDENYKKTASSDASSHDVALDIEEDGDYIYFVSATSTRETAAVSQVKSFKVNMFTAQSQTEDEAEGQAETQAESQSSSDSDSSAQGQESAGEKVVIKNKSLYNSIKGKIILKVEDVGQAFYVHPAAQEMYYLGRPRDAFSIMRSQGIGITNKDIEKIPVDLSNLSGTDSDNDGLPDSLEDALGTKKDNSDTDGDGHSDKYELENGYSPLGAQKLSIDNYFTNAHKGKIFLQVERNGEAWYINPGSGKRHFLGRPMDAFNVMRTLGLGISNNNFDSL